jgi:hypothetical protein
MKLYYLQIFLISLVVFSCKKEEDLTTKTTSTSTTTATPTITSNSNFDYDGALYASTSNDVNSDFIHNYTAIFRLNGAIVNGGSVSASGTNLTQGSPSGSYTYYNDISMISGTTNWNVTGNTAKGVPAFTHTSETIPTLSLPTVSSISRSNTFTFSHSTITADSIVYTLQGVSTSNIIQKKKAGTSSSAIFTAAELNSLPSNISTVTFGVRAFNIDVITVNQKRYLLNCINNYSMGSVNLTN